jgi:hypothetical protein
MNAPRSSSTHGTARAGHTMWFEPASVVHYQLWAPITTDDIRVFDWRWNMRSILAGYRYFEQKWGLLRMGALAG